jgi:superfamily II DNA or RNA helicase
MAKVKAGLWDGKIRFVSYNGQFPLGMFEEIKKTLIEWNESFSEQERRKLTIDEDLYIYEPIDDLEHYTDKYLNTGVFNRREPTGSQEDAPGVTYWPPHDYQYELVRKALEHKQCIIEAATSSGKTFMLSMICTYLLKSKKAKKILVIVPKVDLVVQGQRDLMEYGMKGDDIGMVFGKVKDYDCDVTISTWQSMNLDDEEYFHQFDALVIDECHGARASADGMTKSKKSDKTIMRKIIDLCINSVYRIGLTGTLPDDKVDVYTIMGGLGPIVGGITARELMDLGKVSQLKILVATLNYPKSAKGEIRKFLDQRLQDAGKGTLKEVNAKMKKAKEEGRHENLIITERYNAENDYLFRHKDRNKFLCKVVNSRLKKNENILILLDKRDHAETATKYIKKYCKNADTVFYIDGNVDIDFRAKSREYTEENERVVTIATLGVYSTGVSIKKLHSIVFFSGGKAKIKTLQAVGRSLRKHKSKKKALLIDICDMLPYSEKHVAKRLEFYTNEKHDISFKDFYFEEREDLF